MISIWIDDFYIIVVYMGKKHDRIMKRYSQQENIDFVDNYIKEIYTDAKLCDVFVGINSPKTPDLIYITELDEIYIGEIKGNDLFRNRIKAETQVMKYCDILKRRGYETIPFIIVGSYVEVFKTNYSK